MNPEYKIPEETQQIIRKHLAEVLEILRAEQTAAGRSEVGRGVSIAITEFEKTSMVVIRSFFADKPYSPLQLLQPKAE